MYLKVIGCEDGKWMEVAEDHVHLRVFGISTVEPSGYVTGELLNQLEI